MSERQAYIRADKPANQELTARAIGVLAAWMDIADDRDRVTVYPALAGAQSDDENARAWMWATLLIADVAQVDSVTLRALAATIFKGVQGVLET